MDLNMRWQKQDGLRSTKHRLEGKKHPKTIIHNGLQNDCWPSMVSQQAIAYKQLLVYNGPILYNNGCILIQS